MTGVSLTSDAKKLLLSILIAIALLGLPFYGNSIYVYLEKPAVLSEGKSIVKEVEKFRAVNHHFPKSLKELGYPASSRWLYYSYEGEAGAFGLYKHVGWLGLSVDYYSDKDTQYSGWWLQTANGDYSPAE